VEPTSVATAAVIPTGTNLSLALRTAYLSKEAQLGKFLDLRICFWEKQSHSKITYKQANVRNMKKDIYGGIYSVFYSNSTNEAIIIVH